MPPVNQQGSKAGLITALIIAVILFMVSVIMTITTNTDLKKTQTDLANLKKTYQAVAHTDQLSGETSEVETLNSAKEKLNLEGGASTVEVALAQIKKLTADITGTPSQNYTEADSKAIDAVMGALQSLKSPGAAAPTSAPSGTGMPDKESLITVITKLQTQLKQTADTNAKHDGDMKKLSDSLGERVAGWNAQVAELTNKVADADKRAAEAEKAKADLQAQYATKQASADDSNKNTQDTTAKQIADMTQTVAQAKAEAAKLNKEVDTLRNQLAKYRMDVKDAAVRQADGTLIRIPSSTVCYISLGAGDHLPAGTSFEVYDKNDGIPGLGPDPLSNNNLPIGKASIEVIRVGQNSSECRIVHLQPGATLAEGDLIANLVYDRNTTFRFFVYGNFDVDGNNVWTAQEADVVKSLVTRWGGKVDDKISVATDFVVLGQEPQVPVFNKDEGNDPLNKDKFDKAVAALAKYQDVINQAATLHIPIMNQNRFMYYIGYYDLMKR